VVDGPYASANGDRRTTTTIASAVRRSRANAPQPIAAPVSMSRRTRSSREPDSDALALPPPARPPAAKHSAARGPSAVSAAFWSAASVSGRISR